MDKKLQSVKQKNADMKEFLSYVDTLAEKSKEGIEINSPKNIIHPKYYPKMLYSNLLDDS